MVFEGKIGTLYQIFTPCTPSPNTNRHLLDFGGGPIACQDAEGFFTGGFPKNSPHDVQTKWWGGSKAF